MKKRNALTLALALLLCLTACSSRSAAPQLLEPVDVAVQTTPVTRGDVVDAAVYEAVTKPQTVACGFSAAGQVNQVLAVRGAQVEAGDVLATLNTDLLQAQADTLTAQIRQTTAQGEFEDRRAALEQEQLAQGGEADAQARIALLQSQQAQARAEREAQLADLNAQLQQTQAAIDQSVLTAPCSGTVLAVCITEGGQAMPGGAALYMTDDSTLEVVTDYIEDKLLLGAAAVYATVGGQVCQIENIPYERQEYLAKKAAGEDLESTFAVVSGQAEAGMYTLIYVISAQSMDTLVLPAGAVFHDADGYYVYCYGDSGQTRVPIEAGVVTDAQVEVLSGLEEGDAVYVGS